MFEEMEPRQWFGWTIPPGYVPDNVAPCRGCGQQILWCRNENGKRSPRDRNGSSHFRLCPARRAFGR